jgi:hypothetical protein
LKSALLLRLKNKLLEQALLKFEALLLDDLTPLLLKVLKLHLRWR